MPSIDVNEVVLSDDIAGESFEVLRRSERLVDGVSEQTPVLLTGMRGAIAPTGDNSLVRQEAYSAQNQTIQVVTSFMLRGSADETSPAASWQPDLVVWRRAYYIVRTVNNFSQYGRGFIQAECESFDYVGPAPQQVIMPGGMLNFVQPLNSGLSGVL